MGNTLLVVNITPICKRWINLSCLLILSYARKKKKPGFYLQQAENILTFLLNMFFHRRCYKNSCLSELQYPYENLMICSFKDFLRNVALNFVFLNLKA